MSKCVHMVARVGNASSRLGRDEDWQMTIACFRRGGNSVSPMSLEQGKVLGYSTGQFCISRSSKVPSRAITSRLVRDLCRSTWNMMLCFGIAVVNRRTVIGSTLQGKASVPSRSPKYRANVEMQATHYRASLMSLRRWCGGVIRHHGGDHEAIS